MSNQSITRKSIKNSFRQKLSYRSTIKPSTNPSLQLSTNSFKSLQKNNKNIINNSQITGLCGKPLSFYFDSSARKKIVIKTINKYIEPNKNTQGQIIRNDNPQIERRISKSCQNQRKKKVNQANKLRVTFDSFNLKNIQSVFSQQFNQTLPVISEIYDDKQFRPFSQTRKRRNQSHQNKFLSMRSNFTSSIFDNNSTTLSNDQKKTQKKLTQCQFYQVSKIREGNKLKKYKKFSQQGNYGFSTQKKVKDMGVPILWQKSIFSNTLIYPIKKSLKQQILSMVSFLNGNEKIYKIFPKPQYKNFIQNGNQFLIDMIVGVCKQLNKFQGRIMNNKLSLDNIYILQEKQIKIQDWSCSSIREVLKVITKTFVTCKKPNIRGKSEWMSNPFYLAPQILQYESKQFDKIQQLWQTNPTASDIWSLGLIIFQILTFIPLDMNYRASVKGKNIFRKGIFAMQRFDKDQLNRKQKKFQNSFKDFIIKQCEKLNINNKILQALQGMLVYDKRKRISAGKVLQILTGKKQ